MDHSEVAERLISPVSDTWSTLLGKDNSLTGMALSIRARSCQKHNRFEEAELLQIQAMVARQVAIGPSHPLTLEMKHDYVMLLYDMGDVAGAQQILWETLQGQKDVLRDDHPNRANCRELGTCSKENGLKCAAFGTFSSGDELH